MTTGEIISLAFGMVGVGGAVASIYIRATISDTIIQKLNGRYTGNGLCRSIHKALDEHLKRIEHQADQLQEKLDRGFDSVTAQLVAAQVSRNNIAKHDAED